jgi:group I intron endonuclease
MYGYIYKTTNSITGKIYIGQHKGDFDIDYLGSGLYLENAVKKYGKNNFVVILLAQAIDKRLINTLEKYYIEVYRRELGKNGLYNIADGGDGGFVMCGDINPTKRFEVREKLRIASLGKHPSEETKEKIRLAGLGNCRFKGKHHSDKTKEKDRLSSLGKHHTKESKEKLRLYRLGKHHTEESKEKLRGNKNPSKRPEVREKLRLVGMGDKNSARRPEVREKMRLARLGKHHSEETKEKIRLARAKQEVRKKVVSIIY